MIAGIKAAAKEGDSLGGIVEVLGYGVPVGLGSHVHWDRKIDGLLGQALLSIQAVKGVELGDGFTVAAGRGSDGPRRHQLGRRRARVPPASTRAGGVEGGMTTGELLVARVAMKPLATLNRPTLGTVDVATKEETVSFKERTDVTAVPAMGVVAETMVALVLANEVAPQVRRRLDGRAASATSSRTACSSRRHTDRVETEPARPTRPHRSTGTRPRPSRSPTSRRADARRRRGRPVTGDGDRTVERRPRSTPACADRSCWSG